MEASNIIAVFALVVSVLSALFSYRAQKTSADLREREVSREFAREKSEFMVRTENAGKLFKKFEDRLKELISQVEAEPESIRDLFTREIGQLKSDMSFLQGCQRQVRALLEEAYEIGQDGLAYHKPRYLNLIESDEKFAAEAFQRADLVENELRSAKRLKQDSVV